MAQEIAAFARSIQDMWSLGTSTYNVPLQKSAQFNLVRVSHVIGEKLDNATTRLLRYADQSLNKFQELQIEESTKDLGIALWGSYADMRPIRKAIVFEKIGVNIDVPKQILANESKFLFRVIRLPIETITLSDYLPNAKKTDASGMMNRYILGDLIVIELLKSPPDSFSLRAKKWVMRDKSSLSLVLQKSTYPSSVTFRCSIRVPDELFMTEDVTLSRWDEQQGVWTDEGITDYQFSEANRLVQFYSVVVGTFALVKPRNVDMPYKRWTLQPLRSLIVNDNPIDNIANQMARFTISTQKHEVVIDLVGTKVKLVRPVGKQLNDIIGVEMNGGVLLKQLQKRGINLWPEPKTSIDDRVKDDKEFKVVLT